MKVKYNNFRGTVEFNTIKEAVKDALTPDAYSYDGQLEGLNAQIEKLQECVATLVECMYGETQYSSKVDQLTNILGYSYEVEE